MRVSLHLADLHYGGGLVLHTASSGSIPSLTEVYLRLDDGETNVNGTSYEIPATSLSSPQLPAFRGGLRHVGGGGPRREEGDRCGGDPEETLDTSREERSRRSQRSWCPRGPAPAAAGYEVRHGFGVTRCTHASHGLEHDTTLFVPREDPLKVVSIAITNLGSRPRRLAVSSAIRIPLILG